MNCELWREKCGNCIHLLCREGDVDFPCDLEYHPSECPGIDCGCELCKFFRREPGTGFFIASCIHEKSTNEWVEIYHGEKISEALIHWVCPL